MKRQIQLNLVYLSVDSTIIGFTMFAVTSTVVIVKYYLYHIYIYNINNILRVTVRFQTGLIVYNIVYL